MKSFAEHPEGQRLWLRREKSGWLVVCVLAACSSSQGTPACPEGPSCQRIPLVLEVTDATGTLGDRTEWDETLTLDGATETTLSFVADDGSRLSLRHTAIPDMRLPEQGAPLRVRGALNELGPYFVVETVDGGLVYEGGDFWLGITGGSRFQLITDDYDAPCQDGELLRDAASVMASLPSGTATLRQCDSDIFEVDGAFVFFQVSYAWIPRPVAGTIDAEPLAGAHLARVWGE